MTRILSIAAFLVGLAVVGWIGAGYVGSNPLALAVTALIGVAYLAGTWELRRYQQATATLARALAALSDAPAGLAGWLDQLHPSLRSPVRLRVEGDRVALPGPALTPYLVGLLVLLGMLGTFLGMVATLRGTGIALESATDLQAIRASLAAPVKGLGFAFGTSVAGVATSAMLGLLSALCRRERILAAQQLDTGIATTLRGHTLAHQRDETFRLLQRQAETMPVLVDRLQAMVTGMEQRNQALNAQLADGMAAMERQHAALSERLAAGQAALDQRLASGQQALNERLGAGQEAFHGKTEAAYAGLAASVQQTLKESAAESARLAATALQPVVEAMMATLSGRFETTAAAVGDVWNQALTQHRQANDTLAQDLRATLDRYADTFEQRSTGLIEGVAARMDSATGGMTQAWADALARQEQTNGRLAQDNQQALAAAAATFERHSATLLEKVEAHASALLEKVEGQSVSLLDKVGGHSVSLIDKIEGHSASLIDKVEGHSASLIDKVQGHSVSLVDKVEGHYLALLDKVEGHSLSLLGRADTHSSSLIEKVDGHLSSLAGRMEDHASALRQGLGQHATSVLENIQQHSAALLQAVEQSQARQQATLESRDQERLDAWTGKLDAIAHELSEQWRQTGEQTAARQQEICETLSRTARDITEQTQARARDTIAEIERLVQAASEAPKAAADVVAELRQKLSDTMVRDNAMLEERGRLLDTLGTLLDAVNRASTEQRDAVDALVATSSDLLARVGGQFTDTLEAETAKLAEAAGQVSGSVVEVASLGDAFGTAVQAFGESNEKLMAHLQRIEGALEKSIARSDEQLAYYVAQAREAIDLSVMSQKQIIEDLQRLAEQRASAGSEAA
ncbi:chemotaxis protein [Bordetella sp. H567]|uniref:DUF802 domain-containing protein n=1 Tax=Bordetella sp. H567 TaxID=1697043 RepID=UPI00081C5607|nr:DUF802 domain-containing protein [Bordetella sp. H567]AOB31279.1 chemotaxis protein [Bordetella sp. H567]